MCGDDQLACWLCDRPFGTLIQWHHPVPRAKKGRIKVPVHAICHQAIHTNFTNAQLGRMGDDLAAIRAHPEIAKFVKWVSTKPPDFHAPTRIR